MRAVRAVPLVFLVVVLVIRVPKSAMWARVVVWAA